MSIKYIKDNFLRLAQEEYQLTVNKKSCFIYK